MKKRLFSTLLSLGLVGAGLAQTNYLKYSRDYSFALLVNEIINYHLDKRTIKNQ